MTMKMTMLPWNHNRLSADCNVFTAQPFFQLCKLAKQSARECSDVMASFAHTCYIFSQIATRDITDLSLCYDCGEII